MRVCGRCLAEVDPGATVCPACGEPLCDGGREIELGLARANLLRIRGELAAAETQCREILRSSPDCVGARLLLADVLMDRGRLDEAAEQCEAALENDPGSTPARLRLDNISRVRLQPAKPELRPASRIWVWGAFLVIVAAVGTAGYLVGRGLATPTPAEPPVVVTHPIRIPAGPTPPPTRISEADLLQRVGEAEPDIAAAILSLDRSGAETVVAMSAPVAERQAVLEVALRVARAIYWEDPDTHVVRVKVLGSVEGRMETLLTCTVPERIRDVREPLPAEELVEDAVWHATLIETPGHEPLPPEDGAHNPRP
jgi:tetratricopeptide (TPR) repeat protein